MMNELKLLENELGFIPVYQTEKGTKVVYGRELYGGLRVQQAFTTWMQSQLENVDAIENEDFFLLKEESIGGRPRIDYIIKLDIAKEICMVVGVAPRTNEETRRLSKQFRKYFIRIEKKYKEMIAIPSYTIQENPIERAMKRAIAEGTSQETLSVLTEEITKKTIKEVTPILIAEGVNKGIKQGYGQGYTQAELEGKSKLKRELNGQNRGYTYGALATEINKQYINKNGIKIITTHITDYLLEEGYFKKLSFQAKSGGKLKFHSNGEPVMEKAGKQPTYKFIAEVVNTGCATTKEDFRGKVEVKLLDRFEDWFFDNHFNKFIDYIEKTYK